VIYRRKRGLSVPIASWLNDGLRSEVDRLLAPERLRSQGLLDERIVDELLAAHRSGRANNAKPLWALVILQYWIENWSS
jgi:asparagine synthase (glutamine-hydrolysing)